MNRVGEELRKKIQKLGARDDESELDDSGREERRLLLAEQSRNLSKQEVVLHQKAHLKWLKQGEQNNKFFHSIVKWRHYKKTTILRGPKTDAKVKKRTLMRRIIVRSTIDEKSMEANGK